MFAIIPVMTVDTSERDTGLPELIGPRELAGYLGVPVSTIYHWRARGIGPHGFRVGKRVRFRAADVAAWLNERREAVATDEHPAA